MNQQEFEDTLRKFMYHEPFEPFVVELNDGRAILIEDPVICFAGGAAVYPTPKGDQLHFFECEQVLSMQVAQPEHAA